jgi:glycosyltransferase involved in cell wall biosynthesis
MKICISFLSFSKDIFAGIENSIYNLAVGFRALGLDVFVYTGYLSGASNEIDSITVFRSNLLPTVLPEGDDTIRRTLLTQSAKIKDEFNGLMREWQIDCAITCDALWGVSQVSGAWKDLACPIVLSLHVVNTPDLLREAARIPYLFRRAVSQILKRTIEQIQPLDDFLVIPNSIDLARFFPLNNAGRSSKVILCLSRINPDKAIDDLVRAFALFSAKHPEYELWLCGGAFPFGDRGNALKAVRFEVETAGLGGRVRFLPNLKWSEIPEIIRSSFVVVLPTLYESFGRAAIESLACGVPLIATRSGNLPDLVRDAAMLVPPRSPVSIYDCLMQLHINQILYDHLAKRGPLVAADYDNVKVAAQFVSCIQQRI